jgi:hypothetical protein
MTSDEEVEITVLWARRHGTGACQIDRAILREAARAQVGDRPLFDGAVEMSLIAVFPIPKSWPKSRKKAALASGVPCIEGSISLFTITGPMIHGLAGAVYRDSEQVCELRGIKIYGQRPRLEVRITPIKEGWRAAGKVFLCRKGYAS